MSSHPFTQSDPAGTGPAHVIAAHPEQGWSLLSDGTIVFDDSGELLPDGRVIAPAARMATA